MRVFFGVVFALAALVVGGSSERRAEQGGSLGERVRRACDRAREGHGDRRGDLLAAQAAASLVGWAHSSGAVSVGEISAGTRGDEPGGRGNGRALASVGSVTLFGGEITASSVNLRASAHATSSAAAGSLAGSVVSGLVRSRHRRLARRELASTAW